MRYWTVSILIYLEILRIELILTETNLLQFLNLYKQTQLSIPKLPFLFIITSVCIYDIENYQPNGKTKG